MYRFRVGFGKLDEEAPLPCVAACVLDTLLGTSSRRFARFGCSHASYIYRPIRFDYSFDYVVEITDF